MLVGYRLHDDGYAPIHPNAAGRLPSAALGLELTMRDGLLRFFDPAAGEYLRTLEEYAQERKSAEAAKREKEAAEARIAELEAKLAARPNAE